ncbi:MAG: hypothetical protein NZ841_08500, partial [Dictyoglomus sp.]|nr:hypothetical protein [Dictyoglomus sp.]MDW8189322.1 hypothetical protein [Dictyoglomus sp.]
MLDDFEELRFLEELEEYLDRIEKDKSIDIEKELVKIRENIERLNNITKRTLHILGRLMKLIENNKINKIRDSNEKILKKKLPKGL